MLEPLIKQAQEVMVFVDGILQEHRLMSDHWQRRTSPTEEQFNLLATEADLLIVHVTSPNSEPPTRPLSITVSENTTLRLTECFSGTQADYNNIFQVRAGACLQHTLIDQGSALRHYQSLIQLQAQKAQYDLKATLLGRTGTQVEFLSQVQHQHRETNSTQTIRAVVQEGATNSVTGHILVAPSALKTNAHLDHKALLLSEGAIAKVRPQLEIYADDVKCSHGASISQLGSELLFFLQSRGLDLPKARHLLLEGFLAETLPKMLPQAFLNTFLGDH